MKKRPKEKSGHSGKGPASELASIQTKLGYYNANLTVKHWLDTGSSRLNGTLGSLEKGLAYGKMIELFGKPSQGKTLLALLLLAMAQADGAECGWMDFENSWDDEWSRKHDIDPEKVTVFRPELVQDKASSEPRLKTAQELCAEVEAWMKIKHKKNPEGKIYIGLDSITGMLVEDEAEAGLMDQNMRTKVSLATYLSGMLRRWCALCLVYNAMVVFINQTRTSPGIRFGNPEYTTGGNALPFYCSVRAKVRRVKNGRLMAKGRVIGLKGVIQNFKNKAGAGSVENESCGFKAYFLKDDWTFMSAQKLLKEGDDGGKEE